MLIGSHLSTAGGVHNAILAAGEYGFDAVALFVRNQRRWDAPPLTDQAVRQFKLARRKVGVSHILAHGSYLVNLAGQAAVRRKSLAAMADEIERCGRLGIEYLVIHPGANASPTVGIRMIADGLNGLLAGYRRRKPTILLETTAGAGNGIGGTFRQLADILARLDRPKRFGVCLDTCHVFAAGYDIRTPAAYAETMANFDSEIGLDRLLAIHVNDSVGSLASHRDRHAHVGEGQIGLAGIGNFVADERLAGVPFILETPKGLDESDADWDEINVAALVAMKSARPPKRTSR